MAYEVAVGTALLEPMEEPDSKLPDMLPEEDCAHNMSACAL